MRFAGTRNLQVPASLKGTVPQANDAWVAKYTKLPVPMMSKLQIGL